MKDVVEDQKQDTCGDDCQGTMKSITEIEVMPEDEARCADER